MRIKLTTKDKRILYELDMDARQSNSSIAKKVGLSKEVVNYRIKRLESKKVIDNYYAILNIQKIGYMYCRFLIKLQNISPEDEEKLIEHLKKDKRVGWIILLQGELDFAIVMWAKSILEIRKFGDEIMHHYGKYIKEKEVSMATRLFHFKLNYLYDTKDESFKMMGGNIKEEHIDDIDLKILGILANNGRESITYIAEKIGINETSVRYRINNLISENIILGFRAGIDINKLGYRRYKVFMKLEKYNEEILKKIINFLISEKKVVYITEAVGKSDLEFEMDVIDSTEVYDELRKMRNVFPEIIKDYEICMLVKETGINYLPEMKNK
jgi:DNA-binding Lrp family transcriptional regulator